MTNMNDVNINTNTISKVGLKLSDQKINAGTCPDARIFEYPHLSDVFIMENDLYGNIMPKGSCFLAFHGHHGLIGKHLNVETLMNSSVAEIESMVQANTEG